MSSLKNTTNLTITIDKDLKKRVDALFKNLGIDTATAINMFLRQCDRKQDIDFIFTTDSEPSTELLESLQEIEDYKNGKVELESYNDVKVLRNKINL
jgi:DNA-damage-inducible protein J